MLLFQPPAMNDPNDISVTQWIADLRVGEETKAQQELWGRYFNRLLALAKHKLGDTPRAVEDEEDVAVSALGSFFVRVREGQFPDLTDRNGLWPLLAKITANKAVNLHKRQVAAKRGGGRQPESADRASDDSQCAPLELVDDQVTPAELAELSEQCQLLMNELPDKAMREIAELKLAGFTTQEISQQLDLSPRTIERKTGLIRSYWNAWLEKNC
ncbi:ECF-type sigma factor [Aeoliella mucimassa]|uniref:ECF sigma factor n=1 Tax=Aeoliella mucimassa TaxID=2527972 RepID=A0A518AQN8_9BACT|nr:ECF-type sigma factor [Aeoliella mucimassa]QDU57039.1 ECF sigma factor [Aeoliella mucimassa]